MEKFNEVLVAIDDFVWGPPLMILIMLGGILLTVRLGLLQVRKLPLALKWMVKNEDDGVGEVSSFAALCTNGIKSVWATNDTVTATNINITIIVIIKATKVIPFCPCISFTPLYISFFVYI